MPAAPPGNGPDGRRLSIARMTPVEGSPLPEAGRGKEDDSEANAAPGNSGRVLDEILAGVREDVAARQQQVPLERVKELAAAAPVPKDAYAALRVSGVGVIAEVKRSSPSKG